MSSSKPVNGYCTYDGNCGEVAANHCQGCGQVFCTDHYLEHQREVQTHLEHVRANQRLLSEKLKSLVSQLSSDTILDLLEQIYEFQTKSKDIGTRTNRIQEQLQDLISDEGRDLKKQLISMTDEWERDKNDYLENHIDRIKHDIEQLRSKLDDLHETVSHDSPQDVDLKANGASTDTKSLTESESGTSRRSLNDSANNSRALSHLLLKMMSPAAIDVDEDELELDETENESNVDDETSRRVSQKIHLSNNFIRWMRGPLKVMIDGPRHVVDSWAQGKHISESVLLAVKQGLARQRQLESENGTDSHLLKPVFGEITSDWKLEGANPDRGFSSASLWMRDPQGRRILVKLQDHPLCAANEWFAYVFGEFIGLPVNEVQIATHENNLVTLHADVTGDDEKVSTFMDLPKPIRKTLLTDPVMECMYLFDRVMQNVDRNPGNILVTMPKGAEGTAKMQMHLIDHSACFGMGKLTGISAVACKMHSQHLAVVKFDPAAETKKFEQFLSKLPASDRVLIRKTLNRFASISDEQFQSWLDVVQDFLSSAQYERILDVLCRERDIAKRYTIQWGIGVRASTDKINQRMSEIDDLVVYF